MRKIPRRVAEESLTAIYTLRRRYGNGAVMRAGACRRDFCRMDPKEERHLPCGVLVIDKAEIRSDAKTANGKRAVPPQFDSYFYYITSLFCRAVCFSPAVRVCFCHLAGGRTSKWLKKHLNSFTTGCSRKNPAKRSGAATWTAYTARFKEEALQAALGLLTKKRLFLRRFRDAARDRLIHALRAGLPFSGPFRPNREGKRRSRARR